MKSLKYKSLSLLIFVALHINFTSSTLSCSLEPDEDEHPAVTNLRNYLRIRTDHPNPKPGYEEAVEWLKDQAVEIGLEFSEIQLGSENNDNVAVIITWNGTDPSLKSILFNSHMDVVAAEEEKWKYPPFDACKDQYGDIYSRGTTDMKSNTVAVLEALRKLKQSRFHPLRTIHLTVLPDEEIGGLKGMQPFVESEHFLKLNVGLGIDECGGNWMNDSMRICFAEKASLQFNITTKGEPGHGAWFPEYTAAHRLQVILDKLFEFRQQQYDKLYQPGVHLEDVTTVNLVGLGGGTANNIIAGELWAAFDMRIRQNANWTFVNVETFLENVLAQARLGSDDPDYVSIKFLLKTMETGETIVDNSNVWWNRIQDTCKELNIYCPSSVLNAITDARYVRHLGIPVFGFSPFLNTPPTAHKHNEFINEFEFLNGIKRYFTFIRRLSMSPSKPSTGSL